MSTYTAPDLTTRTTTDVEAWRAKIEAKRADAARRRAMEAAVHAAELRMARAPKRRKKAKRTPKPKPAPKIVRGGPPVRPCGLCGHSTRPANARAHDYPGTRRRRGGERCDLCYVHGRVVA